MRLIPFFSYFSFYHFIDAKTIFCNVNTYYQICILHILFLTLQESEGNAKYVEKSCLIYGSICERCTVNIDARSKSQKMKYLGYPVIRLQRPYRQLQKLLLSLTRHLNKSTVKVQVQSYQISCRSRI